MNTLIAALLDCPNLSLRVLDPEGRAIRILNQEEFRHYFYKANQDCTRICDNTACEKRLDQLN